MPKSVFLIPSSGSPEQLQQTEFVNEDELHSLVEQIPKLLDECLAEPSGEWLLVNREMGIPDAAGAADRWALDLFLLDTAGVPTLVEVKRARDPRARREVVAQMLDYAANGSRYWSVDGIRKGLEARSDSSPDFRLIFENVTNGNSDSYWQNVENKLSAGQVRLVFIADHMPGELRRLIEFLNEKMPDIEVLGLEVRQFKVGDRRIAVAETVGNTMRSRDSKNRHGGARGTILSFDEWLERTELPSPNLREQLRDLFLEIEVPPARLKISPSQFTFGVETRAGRVQIVGVDRKSVWLALDSLRRVPALAEDESRRALLKELEAIMGRAGSTQNLAGYPSFDLNLLSNDDCRTRLKDFLNRVVEMVDKASIPD